LFPASRFDVVGIAWFTPVPLTDRKRMLCVNEGHFTIAARDISQYGVVLKFDKVAGCELKER